MNKQTKKKSTSKFPIYSIINNYEQLNHENPRMTCHMKSMFYSLIHIAMTKGGIPEFHVAHEHLKAISKIGSKNTYYKCLKQLDELEIIEYTKGKNGHTMAIVKILLDDTTTTMMKTYWDATIRSTRVPTILSTLHAMEECRRSNYKDQHDGKDILIKKDKDTDSKVQGEVRSFSIEFEKFWALFDLDININGAWTEWKKLNEDEIQEIFTNLPKYLESKKKKEYRKRPANYLKERVWKDEIITIKTKEDEDSERISGSFSYNEEDTL